MNKKIMIFIVAIILFIALVNISDVGHLLSVDNLVENKEILIDETHAHLLLMMIIYTISYIILVAIGLPVFIVYALAGGLMFGFVWGSVLAMFASLLGATLTFLATRSYLSLYFRNKYGHRLERFEKRLVNKQFRVMLGLRVFPGMPYFIITILAGLSEIGLRDFILATFLGNIPKKLLLVYIGYVLRSVDNLNEIVTPRLILPVVGFTLILVMSYFIRRQRKKGR